MARTLITPVTLKDLRYPAPAANSLDIAFTALTGTQGDDGNAAKLANPINILLFWNTHASNSYNVSWKAAGPYNRTGDSGNYALGAGEIAGGLAPWQGMAQLSGANMGQMLFDASNLAVKAVMLRVPRY